MQYIQRHIDIEPILPVPRIKTIAELILNARPFQGSGKLRFLFLAGRLLNQQSPLNKQQAGLLCLRLFAPAFEAGEVKHIPRQPLIKEFKQHRLIGNNIAAAGIPVIMASAL